MVERRIARLPQWIRDLLDRFGAPTHIRRWLAFAPTRELRGARLALAFRLLRPSEGRSGWHWLSDAEKAAVGDLLQRWGPAIKGVNNVVFEAAIEARLAAKGHPLSVEAAMILARLRECETARGVVVAKLKKIGGPE
jgi:hypothetical protein